MRIDGQKRADLLLAHVTVGDEIAHGLALLILICASITLNADCARIGIHINEAEEQSW
jgi:hypothetical protein